METKLTNRKLIHHYEKTEYPILSSSFILTPPTPPLCTSKRTVDQSATTISQQKSKSFRATASSINHSRQTFINCIQRDEITVLKKKTSRTDNVMRVNENKMIYLLCSMVARWSLVVVR